MKIQLMPDTHFQKGFTAMGLMDKTESHEPVGQLVCGHPEETPRWRLCAWCSRFSFAEDVYKRQMQRSPKPSTVWTSPITMPIWVTRASGIWRSGAKCANRDGGFPSTAWLSFLPSSGCSENG